LPPALGSSHFESQKEEGKKGPKAQRRSTSTLRDYGVIKW